jgi:hypothetical protein
MWVSGNSHGILSHAVVLFWFGFGFFCFLFWGRVSLCSPGWPECRDYRYVPPHLAFNFLNDTVSLSFCVHFDKLCFLRNLNLPTSIKLLNLLTFSWYVIISFFNIHGICSDFPYFILTNGDLLGFFFPLSLFFLIGLMRNAMNWAGV